MNEAPKKLVLMTDSLVAGGAQRQLITLANELARRGYRTTLQIQYPNEQLRSFVDDSVSVVLLPRNSKYGPGYIFRLRRWLANMKPDCIISYLNTTNFFARLSGRLASVPIIITSVRNAGISRKRTKAMIERILAPLSTAIVVNAESTRDELLRIGVDEQKVHVIPNGVDFVHFQRSEPWEIAQLRNALGVAPWDFMVVLPGRVSAQKNHELLVEAILGLRTAGREPKVFFAGNVLDQKIVDKLKNRIEAIGKSHQFSFLGRQENMPQLYSAADVVVLPSLWEGFPNVLVEAMACETPVIASDVSDNRLIVEHGKTGFVFPSRDCAALADSLAQMRALSHDERRVMGIAARKRAENLCSVDRLGEQYAGLIERYPEYRTAK